MTDYLTTRLTFAGNSEQILQAVRNKVLFPDLLEPVMSKKCVGTMPMDCSNMLLGETADILLAPICKT